MVCGWRIYEACECCRGGKETTEPADVHKAEGYAGNTISMIPWERRIHGIKKMRNGWKDDRK